MVARASCGGTRSFVCPPAHAAQEFNRFPYAVIKKWLPSHLRSRNPGPENCLDLQIQTDKGARDLRMRCADAPTVMVLIEHLRNTVMVSS